MSIRTVSVGVGDDAAHSDSRGALDEAISDQAIGVCDSVERASDSEDTIVHARHHLADSGTDASLVPQVGDILTCLANNHAGLLGRYYGTQGQLGRSVLFNGSLRRILIGSKTVDAFRDRVDGDFGGGLLGRHVEG